MNKKTPARQRDITLFYIHNLCLKYSRSALQGFYRHGIPRTEVEVRTKAFVKDDREAGEHFISDCAGAIFMGAAPQAQRAAMLVIVCETAVDSER